MTTPELLTSQRLNGAPAWLTRRVRPELIVLLAVAGVANLWDLSRGGWANEYYAAAVRSMTLSWHNFLFVSFDPGGVMTADKPPLGLWVQALSARVFGFNSWSILAPEALMGMGTVLLIYDLVRRRFGRIGGLVAGLTLAITPITIAMSRHNNPDSALILCCVAALWFAARGFEDGRARWIVWSGVMVGLAFEAKMATALLVVPGIAAAWLWVSPHKPLRRVSQLLAGGAALVAVGGAWPLLVALTPAADRPWISGTSDNSIWSLITGYNGLGRISGQTGGPASAPGPGGSTGVFRLLNSALGAQAGWLLGFALVSGIGLVALTRLRRRDPTTGWTIAMGGAFLTSAVVFSSAQGIFRPYYVAFLAPFTAALVGAGAAQIATRDLHGRVLAPLAIAAGAATEVAVLESLDTLEWLEAIIIGAAVLAAVTLTVSDRARLRLGAVATTLAVLSIAPLAWKLQTVHPAASTTAPAGGTNLASGGSAVKRGHAGGQKLETALDYIGANGGGALALSSQASAEDAIVTGAQVAGIGGFSGTESKVSAGWLAQQVHAGKIRWALSGSGSPAEMEWASDACNPAATVDGSVLYHCSGRSAEVLKTAIRH
jgi:4-amino-4-deoxy-L-arabinose transferase-like glycosyltransferase